MILWKAATARWSMGSPFQTGGLKHGDRISIGGSLFFFSCRVTTATRRTSAIMSNSGTTSRTRRRNCGRRMAGI